MQVEETHFNLKQRRSESRKSKAVVSKPGCLLALCNIQSRNCEIKVTETLKILQYLLCTHNTCRCIEISIRRVCTCLGHSKHPRGGQSSLQAIKSTLCTCTCKLRNAVSTDASLSRTALNGLGAGSTRGRRGSPSNSLSASRIMPSNDRPSAWVWSSTSESNLSMSSRRLPQSSCNSHLQNISTSGSICVHVVRSN